MARNEIDLCQVCFMAACDGELERHPGILETEELLDLVERDTLDERKRVWLDELERRGVKSS